MPLATDVHGLQGANHVLAAAHWNKTSDPAIDVCCCPLVPGSDPSVPLEQLWWLVRCAGAVLADSGSGETPMMPLALAAGGRSKPVESLSRALLETLALALEPAARPVLSPRCFTSLILSLAVVSHTRKCEDAHRGQQLLRPMDNS